MRTKKSRWPIILSVAVLALGFGGFAAYKAAIQSFKGKIEQALGPHGEVKEIRVSLTGVEITDLRIRATSGNNTTSWPAEDELRATRILVLPSFADLITGKIVIEKLRIENAYIAMLRARDGKMRVLPSLLEAPGAADKGKDPSNSSSSAANPTELRINRIELVNGAVEFFDATVRTPPHKLRLEQINAAIGRLQLPDLKGISTLDIAGTLKGVKQDGKISISGSVEFATKESGLTTRLRNVDLVALHPYLLKASETDVKSGTLDLDLNSSVQKGVLHAPGTLTLKNLELSSNSGTLMGMPRNIVVGSMKSRGGKITLKFVLDGNIKDPRYSLNENLSLRIGSSLASSLGVSFEGLAKGVGGLGGSTAQGIGNSLGKLLGK